MNTLKSTLLLVTLSVFLILIGARVGGRNGMVLAFAISVALNFGTYFFSDKLALKMYNAQPVTRGTTAASVCRSGTVDGEAGAADAEDLCAADRVAERVCYGTESATCFCGGYTWDSATAG